MDHIRVWFLERKDDDCEVFYTISNFPVDTKTDPIIRNITAVELIRIKRKLTTTKGRNGSKLV
jgi:hypothetical protein